MQPFSRFPQRAKQLTAPELFQRMRDEKTTERFPFLPSISAKCEKLSLKGATSLHSFARQHHGELGEATAYETRGWVMNLGWRYDLLVWLFDTFLLRGTLRKLKLQTADLAQLQPGEAVLDVGCGTGALAMIASQRVGATGRVCGIDPGPKQVARAHSRASRSSLPIDFQVGVIEQLAFPNQSFDVVLFTLVMHHLPDDLIGVSISKREKCTLSKTG